MKKVKTILILFFLSLVVKLAFSVSEDQKVYIKSVQCTVSETIIDPNFLCYAKSYSRNYSTTNVIIKAKKTPQHCLCEIPGTAEDLLR